MNETISILVVDNDSNVLLATTVLLRSAGYFVLEAQTGAACMTVVREKDPDLILLDMQLPDVSGYEVSRQIKADRGMRQPYVVLLSGSMISSDNQSKGLENGADGYLTRPIADRELLARVQAIVRIIWTERDRDFLIEQLEKALATIKTLSGILPICSRCKKIRDDQGYWEEVELYVEKHSTAEFTHGICPDCIETLYPEINIEEELKTGSIHRKYGNL
ncbi:MAG TPA: response regulator [Desulfobulbaceae bacterium]|nr:response regulator [Desulfobulbaceae bacterium]